VKMWLADLDDRRARFQGWREETPVLSRDYLTQWSFSMAAADWVAAGRPVDITVTVDVVIPPSEG
jgi:hypothetical protein